LAKKYSQVLSSLSASGRRNEKEEYLYRIHSENPSSLRISFRLLDFIKEILETLAEEYFFTLCTGFSCAFKAKTGEEKVCCTL
jgi:hypothetical protein